MEGTDVSVHVTALLKQTRPPAGTRIGCCAAMPLSLAALLELDLLDLALLAVAALLCLLLAVAVGCAVVRCAWHRQRGGCCNSGFERCPALDLEQADDEEEDGVGTGARRGTRTFSRDSHDDHDEEYAAFSRHNGASGGPPAAANGGAPGDGGGGGSGAPPPKAPRRPKTHVFLILGQDYFQKLAKLSSRLQGLPALHATLSELFAAELFAHGKTKGGGG